MASNNAETVIVPDSKVYVLTVHFGEFDLPSMRHQSLLTLARLSWNSHQSEIDCAQQVVYSPANSRSAAQSGANHFMNDINRSILLDIRSQAISPDTMMDLERLVVHMGKSITRYMMKRPNRYYHRVITVKDLCFDRFGSVDAPRTFCPVKKFSLRQTVCKCCRTRYARTYKNVPQLKQTFGEYVMHAIAIWKSHNYYSDFPSVFFNNNDYTCEDNMFILSIIHGYMSGIAYFYDKLSQSNQLTQYCLQYCSLEWYNRVMEAGNPLNNWNDYILCFNYVHGKSGAETESHQAFWAHIEQLVSHYSVTTRNQMLNYLRHS